MTVRVGTRVLLGLAGLLLLRLACGAEQWTSVLTRQALQAGAVAKLPPHVSSVLGLADPSQGVEVRQLLARDGQRVRAYNVSVAHHRDLVLFNVDEQSGTTTAYLLSPGGRLRRGVSYHTGGDPQVLQAQEARTGFVREVRFWSARAASATPGGKP